MARRGRCRCGCAISARRGPHGYKTRCPGCSAVVRLRKARKRYPTPNLHKTTCTCGAVVLLDSAGPQACPCCDRQLVVPRAFPERPAPPPQPGGGRPAILDLFEESHAASLPDKTPAAYTSPGDSLREPPIQSPLVQRFLTALTAPVRAASRLLRDR